MIRNSLFIKICLSFWFTTLFMIGSVVTVDWLTKTGPFHSPRHPPASGVALALQGQTGVWVLEHEGVSSLRDFVDRLYEATGSRAYYFDGKGVELTGRPGPRGVGDLAALALSSDRTDPVDSMDNGMAALKIAGSGGETYAVVTELRPLPPPPPPDGRDSVFMKIVRLLVVMTASGAICYVLARYLTAPILMLGAVARRLASGDLSARVGPALGNRNDEISGLALDFDRMAERIESLLTSQRVLLRDISHELRSPLARLHVALELSRQRSNVEAQKSLDRIEREANKLNELIEQLLILNRVESGTSGLERAKINLAKLIGDIAEDADFEATSLNRSVKVSLMDECIIEGNTDLLRRAIENVIRNAVHYTSEGSAVDILLRRVRENDASYAFITIRDHGEGVPEEAVVRLFKPFYRVDDDRNRQTGGAGLGLAITEAAVRCHGGMVRAENSPDGGLMVEIMLPVL
jgi:two-component system, OmpR family, sensor histidine kinase CpxA